MGKLGLYTGSIQNADVFIPFELGGELVRKAKYANTPQERENALNIAVDAMHYAAARCACPCRQERLLREGRNRLTRLAQNSKTPSSLEHPLSAAVADLRVARPPRYGPTTYQREKPIERSPDRPILTTVQAATLRILHASFSAAYATDHERHADNAGAFYAAKSMRSFKRLVARSTCRDLQAVLMSADGGLSSHQLYILGKTLERRPPQHATDNETFAALVKEHADTHTHKFKTLADSVNLKVRYGKHTPAHIEALSALLEAMDSSFNRLFKAILDANGKVDSDRISSLVRLIDDVRTARTVTTHVLSKVAAYPTPKAAA